MPIESAFLGRGWSFPPSFSHGGGEVGTVSGAEDVQQSLAIIFATEPGERVMRPNFGSNLRRFLFAEVDQSLLTSLRISIADAILTYEPRIKLDSIDIAESEETAGLLTISLHYTIRRTNSRFNMVLPFYINEAMAPR